MYQAEVGSSPPATCPMRPSGDLLVPRPQMRVLYLCSRFFECPLEVADGAVLPKLSRSPVLFMLSLRAVLVVGVFSFSLIKKEFLLCHFSSGEILDFVFQRSRF